MRLKNTTQAITLFLLLLLFAAGCNDHTVDPITANCRLTEITGAYIDGTKSTFEYDANGRVSRQIRSFGTNGADGTFSYKHTYDASGKLSRSDIQNFDGDGKVVSEAIETYTWANNQIVRFNYEENTGYKGVNNLTYNASGQLIGFTFEFNDPATDAKWAYSYDANGVVTRRLLTSLDGANLIFEARLTYTTKELVKTAFSLMPKAGQPVDLILSRPWETVYPKNDGTIAYYFPDANGQPEVFAKGNLTGMTFTQSGIATSWSYRDIVGDLTSPVRFQINGCQ
ncbi:MAG: hypothetical protein LH609_15895 [Rudanella sp.]|nr:hypothetical protein [Rudanella sp.]